MKIAHTADIHYEHTKNMPFTDLRHVNTRKIMDFMVERSIDEGVEAFLIAGDVFDTGKASHESVESFVDAIRPLADKKIPVVIIAGNHDVKRIPLGHRTPLHRIRDVSDQFHVMFEIGSVVLPNGLRIVGFPWVSKKFLIEQKGIDLMTDSLGESNAWVTEFYEGELTDEVAETNPDIILGHFTVSDILPEYRGSEVDMMNDPWEHIVSSKTLEDFRVKYVGLGHIHKACQVGDNIYYPGSPERFTIREQNDPKGFKIFDISSGEVSTIPTPARQVVVVESISDIETNAEALASEFTIVGTRSTSNETLMVLSDELKKFPARLVSQKKIGDEDSTLMPLTSSEVEEITLSPLEGMKMWLPEGMRDRESNILEKFERIVVGES